MTKERLDEIADLVNDYGGILCAAEIAELLSAARESIRLQAENAKLKKHEEAARRPDPLGEALNTGDGSYRP